MASKSSRSAPARVRFSKWVNAADASGFPHYDELAKLNADYEAAYERLLRQRRTERQTHARGPASAWARHAERVRTELAAALGLARTRRSERPPAAVFEHAVPLGPAGFTTGGAAWGAPLKASTYAFPCAGWNGADLRLLELRARDASGPRPALLVLPDAGLCLNGCESPAAAARGLFGALASAGTTVGFPRLPSLEAFSATRNKERLLEGACVLGEALAEASAALGALRARPGIDGARLFVAGRGLGGLLALLLGALDERVAGVLAEAPLAWGDAIEPVALAVPGSHRITDLPEVCALLAPRPLLLLEGAPGSPQDPVRADVRALLRAAKPVYAKARAALKRLPAGATAQAVAWLQRQCADASSKESKTPVHVSKAAKPYRAFAIPSYRTGSAWRQDASKLRRRYRAQIGLPPVSKPLSIRQVGETALPDATRFEYLIRTGPQTGANLTFLRPHGSPRRRATILCLPGSGSDVKKVEGQYAHEVVAEGWNAAIVDARAALYPFCPGISEGRAIIAQSMHDLICALDAVAERADVDPERIGTMGVSQGGTHSWMLAALDERIAASAPVCGVCTYASLSRSVRDERYDSAWLSFLDSHGIYYYTPGVLELGDQQDLCGLIAPRPFALIGADKDNCFPLDGMREAAADLKRLYKLLRAGTNFRYVEFDGPHSMPEHSRKTAYAFFRRHFGSK